MENQEDIFTRTTLDSVLGHGIYVESEQLTLIFDDLEKRLIQKELKTLSEQFTLAGSYRLRIKSLSLPC